MTFFSKTLAAILLLASSLVVVKAQDSATVQQGEEITQVESAKLNLSAWDQDKTNTTKPTDPNVSYVFPSASKRFHRYVKNTVGPLSLLKSAAGAGLSHWDDDPLEWGQGAEGYGKRLASNIGSNAIRQSVTYGLSEALHLDTGFEKSKRKGFWPRLSDALVQNVTSRNRSGKRIISAPIFAGAYAGSIIPSETWYPDRYSYKDGLRSGTYSLGTGFAINIVREFLFNW